MPCGLVLEPTVVYETVRLVERGVFFVEPVGLFRLSQYRGNLSSGQDMEVVYNHDILPTYRHFLYRIEQTQAILFYSAAFPSTTPTNTVSTDADSFDTRSDDKGAEPEGLAITEIDGRSVPCVTIWRTRPSALRSS